MKAESHHTGGIATVYESCQEVRSVGPARHYHKQLTELFYVLEGELAFLLGDDRQNAPVGAAVFVPPGTVHAFRNAVNTPARLLIMVVPGGFEGFFDEAKDIRAPMGHGAPWQGINERWDTFVVGPPLEP